MRICDLSSGVIRLGKSAKRLREQWDETKAHWNDQNSVDFEHECLQTLAPQLSLTVAAVNRLGALLEQAERDCWDEDRA